MEDMERKGSKMREGGGMRGTRWKKEHVPNSKYYMGV